MRVFAVGATGFLGSHVVRILSEWGNAVMVLHRGATRPQAPSVAVQALPGRREDLLALRPAIARFRPDVVLDVIPYTGFQARTVRETFRGIASRVVALSSGDVYRNYDGLRGNASAPPDPMPLTEDAPLRATRFPYRGSGLPHDWADDYDKIPVEQVVLGAPDLPGTVLRLPALWGPGDRQHRIRPYLRRMDDLRPAILLSAEQAGWRWTRGYVEDVAAAIALAVVDGRAANRIYNVGEEPAASEREWIEQIGRAAGWHGRIVQVPAAHLPPHLRAPFDFRYELAMDTSRIRSELGYAEHVGREEGLRRTVAWERAQADGSQEPDYPAEDRVLESLARSGHPSSARTPQGKLGDGPHE